MARESLSIFAYRDEDFTQRAEPFQFAAEINPERVSLSKAIYFVEESRGSTMGQTRSPRSYENDELRFDLSFDGTGTIPNISLNVAERIRLLEKVTYNSDETIHKPNYLLIQWGNSFEFKGHLKSMAVEYTLFKPSGEPLRARVSLAFIEFNRQDEKQYESSPDLTHMKIIRSRDSLPQLCNEVYKDISWYPQIAMLNGLVNFRMLKHGTQIQMPPLSN